MIYKNSKERKPNRKGVEFWWLYGHALEFFSLKFLGAKDVLKAYLSTDRSPVPGMKQSHLRFVLNQVSF